MNEPFLKLKNRPRDFSQARILYFLDGCILPMMEDFEPSDIETTFCKKETHLRWDGVRRSPNPFAPEGTPFVQNPCLDCEMGEVCRERAQMKMRYRNRPKRNVSEIMDFIHWHGIEMNRQLFEEYLKGEVTANGVKEREELK